MTDTVATPVLRLKVSLAEAGKWMSTDKDGSVTNHYQWTPDQWKHIEMVAFKLVIATMQGHTEWSSWEECITPEAMDFWEEDLPDDLFKGADELGFDEHLNGCSTAIGVVDAILAQMEEEIGKRGGSLP
jgi:hypothetical protein